MRKHYLRFIPLILMGWAGMGASNAQPANLLPNGGFEVGLGSWSFQGAATWEVVSDQAPEGQQALRVTIPHASPHGANVRISQSGIRIDNELVYLLTFWAKASEDGSRATAVFSAPGHAGAWRDTTNIYIGTQWAQHQAILPSTLPHGTQIEVALHLGQSQGVLHLDDMALRRRGNTWFEGAEYRIQKHRMGNFAIRAQDRDGNPVGDSVRIRLAKHEFPWGTAFDMTDNPAGNIFTTTAAITAPADHEIYQSERWAPYLAYKLPAQVGNTYRITLKLAEIWFNAPGSRLFDVYIDDQRVIEHLDKFALAQGMNRAFDTTLLVVATDTVIHLKLIGTRDNASIMGIVMADDDTGAVLLRLNCGGGALTTASGNTYASDFDFVDRNVVNPFPTEDDWRKAVMVKYCNFGVCGNQFKWSGIEPNRGVLNYEPFENTIRWFQSVGWDFRAHTLLWGAVDANDHHAMPGWVSALPPDQMYQANRMRVEREVARYRGIIREYDLLNEPVHARFLQSQVGDSINWNAFKWAHAIDPDARLFINDYNVVEWQYATDAYVALIRRMLDEGAPIHGIGTQCHFDTYVDVPAVKRRLDQLAQFGIPIKVTEFDMAAAGMTQLAQAVETSKFMRLAFSHPAIEGFIFWGLFNPAWRETISNLFNADRTPRIVADSVYHLIHRRWSTDIDALTNPQGIHRYRAFYGDYEVMVRFPSGWRQFEVSNRRADEGSIVVLREDQGAPTSPQLVRVTVTSPTTVELTFCRPMSNPADEHMHFRVFAAANNTVASAALKAGDSTAIVLTMRNPVNPTNFIPVSYAPGGLTAADGGVLQAFGPAIDHTLRWAYISSATSRDGRTIAMDFKEPIDAATLRADEFTVRVNNVAQTPVGIALNPTRDTVRIELATQILSDAHRVTLSYHSGTMLTAQGQRLVSFANQSVTNRVLVPQFASGRTTNPHTVALRFTSPVDAATAQLTALNLQADGARIDVVGCAPSPTNPREVQLTLSGAIGPGDRVTIAGSTGALASPEGIPVRAFTGDITNTVVTSMLPEPAEGVRLYPNPITNRLVVTGIAGFQLLTITDVLGRVQLQQPLAQGMDRVEVNTSALPNGIYLLSLTGHNRREVFRVVKQ